MKVGVVTGYLLAEFLKPWPQPLGMNNMTGITKYERNESEASSGGFISFRDGHRTHGPAPATSTELLTYLTHSGPSCKGMWKVNVFSFKGIWSRTFSMQKNENNNRRKP